MIKKEMIAMLLAGGQGSRLGVLTSNLAKPAVAFGGKYKIIDFPLSNCINSGVDTVGVLTQYRPLRLNQHIGIGIPWDLDRNIGGVTVLPPYEKSNNSEWYTGTANAIYQNLEFIDYYNPDYVLILSGDHIYKMDYEHMLEYHKSCNADITLATYEVPWEEASRFGVVIADDDGVISEFEEKPANPRSNKASMGIYIFSWKVLREALVALKDQPECDFGKHVIPYCHGNGKKVCAYDFKGYWKDVGTLESLWDANMDMLSPSSGLDLQDESWPIYARSVNEPPTFIGHNARMSHCAINRGSVIEGVAENSVLSPGVVVGEGARVTYSVLLPGTVVEPGAVVEYAILGEDCRIGRDCRVGGTPENAAPGAAWGLTVLGPGCQVAQGRQVAAGTMLNSRGEEVSK